MPHADRDSPAPDNLVLRGIDSIPYSPVRAADTAPDAKANLDSQLRYMVLPFVQTYCVGCHGKDKPKADLNLTAFTSVESVAKNYPQWLAIRDQLTEGMMPPEAANSTTRRRCS